MLCDDVEIQRKKVESDVTYRVRREEMTLGDREREKLKRSGIEGVYIPTATGLGGRSLLIATQPIDANNMIVFINDTTITQ